MGPDHTLYTVTTARALAVLILQKLHLGPPSRSGANGREYLFETQSGAEGNILTPPPPPLYSDVVSGCKSVQCTSNRLMFCCHLQRLQIFLTINSEEDRWSRPFHLFVLLFVLYFFVCWLVLMFLCLYLSAVFSGEYTIGKYKKSCQI